MHTKTASVLWQKWATQRARLQPDRPRSFGGDGLGGGPVAAQRHRCAPRVPGPPRLGSDSLGLVKDVTRDGRPGEIRVSVYVRMSAAMCVCVMAMDGAAHIRCDVSSYSI